jgi:hypothetical protein
VELFDSDGCPSAEIVALAPVGERRMGANPHANGGLLLRDLRRCSTLRRVTNECAAHRPAPTAGLADLREAKPLPRRAGGQRGHGRARGVSRPPIAARFRRLR